MFGGALGSPGGDVAVFRQDPVNTLPLLVEAAWSTAVFPSDVSALAAADFDGDGLLDLARTGTTGPDPECLLSNLGDAWTLDGCSPSTSGSALVASDFDGDGIPDLLVGPGDAAHNLSLYPAGLLSLPPVELLDPTAALGDVSLGPISAGDEGVDGLSEALWSTDDGVWVVHHRPESEEMEVGWCAPDYLPIAAWADADRDGDLDIARVTTRGLELLRSERIGPVRSGQSPPSVQIQFLDNSGAPVPAASIPGASSLVHWQGPFFVEVALFDPESDPVPAIELQVGTWGGGWEPMTLISGPATHHLSTDLSACAQPSLDGCLYTWIWDPTAHGPGSDARQARVVVPAQGANRMGASVVAGPVAAQSLPVRMWPDCDGSDLDADGFTCQSDCDDSDASIHPGGNELCDGIDNDCDGAVDDGLDLDGDGASCGDDCDDSDPTIFLGAAEVVGDGVDQNCNGVDALNCFEDADDDGIGAAPVVVEATECWGPSVSPFDDDCDDSDPAVSPLESEVCDGIDTDCDGQLDPDEDGDGSDCIADCDDQNPAVGPLLPEVCDGLDTDCDGVLQDVLDNDGDGFDFCADCDDADAASFPGATERASDGIDSDCDGFDGAICFTDLDGDSFGAGPAQLMAQDDCASPSLSSSDTDCDEADDGVFPGAPEACDYTDSDCDGDLVDGFPDLDSDGLLDCLDPLDPDLDGYTTDDCAPTDPSIHPEAPESCDLIDSDCDGSFLDGEPESDCDGYPDCVPADADGDGYLNGDDCEPWNPAVHPGALDLPEDGIDNDCDGIFAIFCFEDLDLDGFGGSELAVVALDGDCDDPRESYSSEDCDDTDPFSYPGAPEICDGRDNDCLGDAVSEDTQGKNARDYFFDGDGDGVGLEPHPNNRLCADPGVGWVDVDGDCDDGDPTIHPGAEEACDAVDSDCDGSTVDGFADLDDDGVPDCIDPDADGDTYLDDDCDDLRADVHPGAEEACDGVDTDCEGTTLDGEVDADADGSWACADCDDLEPAVTPGKEEVCDGLDNDCIDGVSADEFDVDEDGFRPCEGDCDDFSSSRRPGAAEVCSDLTDVDCDGAEAELGSDPECWGPDCSGCSQSEPPRTLGLALLVLVALRRRRRPRGGPGLRSLVVAVGLFATSAQAADLPTGSPLLAVQEDLLAGRCTEALATMEGFTSSLGPELLRLRATARRCLGDDRGALFDYRAYLDAGGSEIRVRFPLQQLAAQFGTLILKAPAPVLFIEQDGERIPPTALGNVARLEGIAPGLPLTLVTGGARREPAWIPLSPLVAGEHREMELPYWPSAPAWFRLGPHNQPDLTVEVWQPHQSHQLLSGGQVELLAGEARVVLTRGTGRVEAPAVLEAGETLTFDPTPWLPVSLALPSLPVGSRVSAFVEGARGVQIETSLELEVGETFDPDTGIPLAAPATLEGLVRGAGGLYLDHPELGSMVAELKLDGRGKAPVLDWRALPQVASVETSWTDWSARRRAVRLRTAGGTSLGVGLTVGGVITSIAAGVIASGAEAEALGFRGTANTAAEQADWGAARGLQEQHGEAMSTRERALVVAGVAAAAATVGAVVTIVVPVRGRVELSELGDWEAWEGAGPPPR